MRSTLIILTFSVLFANLTLGQTIDSIYTLNINDGRGEKRWMIKDHITIETNKIKLSSIEEAISELESQECKALLKRDTTALKNIWLRDFTLDEPQNELYVGKNPIPYYVGVHRTIEKFTILDNVVYTSGYENIGLLKSDGKVEVPIIRKFTHVWTKKLFTWRLASKSYE